MPLEQNAMTTTAESPVTKTREQVVSEAKRIEEDALYSSKGHFFAAERWAAFHLWIGLPTTVLAAVAAASAFARFDSSQVAAGTIAIAVAALTAVTTFVNPRENASAHLTAGNKYDALMNKTRIFWTIDAWLRDSDGVLSAEVKALSLEKERLNADCPQIPGWAYKRAKKGIEAGEALHAVDKK